jgi:hypothetical protein
MEDIKFIKEFAKYIERDQTIVGNCIYYRLGTNRAKTYAEEYGVWVEIINPVSGLIDKIRVPFSKYFQAVRCSVCAPTWTQTIEHGEWRFKHMPHTQPKASDYKAVANAMNEYMKLFEV